MLARTIRLKPGRLYTVIFHDSFLAEIATHPKGDELLVEIDRDLSISERDLRRNAITKVHEAHGVALYRYKPTTDRDIRILYSPRGRRRDVVMAIPRSTDYRRSDLDAAVRRALGRKP